VVVATLLIFVAVVAPLAFASVGLGSFHVTWFTAIHLAIAAGVIAPSLFPWSGAANKPVLFWMVLTFAAVTLLVGTSVLLVRL
jgi:hypothetical protein